MDIANMVLFLCSEKAGFITGENICIDGGMTKQMIYHGDCGGDLTSKSRIRNTKCTKRRRTMKFKMIHENYNVSDLDRSIKFYNEALDLHEVRRKTTDDLSSCI